MRNVRGAALVLQIYDAEMLAAHPACGKIAAGALAFACRCGTFALPVTKIEALNGPRPPRSFAFMNRRFFLLTATALTLPLPAAAYEITHSDAQWQKILTPDQYNILRQAGTEPPGSSVLLNETRAGIYSCAGCALPLFSSKTKYDSGEGWPSFWAPLPNAILTSADDSLGMDRTEVHCRRCGGHLGHVFPDGPPPTGLRYCIDGLALVFKAG